MFGVSPTEPATFAAVTGLLLATALAWSATSLAARGPGGSDSGTEICTGLRLSILSFLRVTEKDRPGGLLLDLQDLFFLGLGGASSFCMWPSVIFWISSWRASSVVFADHLVLQQLLDCFVAVAADVAHRHAMIFGDVVQPLDQILAALFGEGGIGRRISLPSLAGFRPRSDARMAFSIGPICETSHGWMVISDGSGTCRLPLIQRRGRAVVIHADVIEKAQRGAAGADGRHFVLQIAQRLLHAGLGVASTSFTDLKGWPLVAAGCRFVCFIVGLSE